MNQVYRMDFAVGKLVPCDDPTPKLTDAERAANLARSQEQARKYQEAVDASRAHVDSHRPAGVGTTDRYGRSRVWEPILGELVQDDCDLMTDYFATKTTKTVLLGFHPPSRLSFKNLRKAAATYEPTRYLASAPKDAEKRENWSMGHGNYLKATDRYSSGWEVLKGYVSKLDECSLCGWKAVV